MANVISEYITRFNKPYEGLSLADMVKEAYSHRALFVEPDGVLGLKPENDGVWNVLFFVTESKETRKKLVQRAAEQLGKISIRFIRWKHGNRERAYPAKFWERLLS